MFPVVPGFDVIIAYSTSAAWLQAKKREELWWQFTRSLACHSLPIFLSIIRLRHKFDQWIDRKQYTYCFWINSSLSWRQIYLGQQHFLIKGPFARFWGGDASLLIIKVMIIFPQIHLYCCLRRGNRRYSAAKKLMEQRSGCHENRDRPSDFGLHRQKGEHFQYTRAKYVHVSNKGAQKLSYRL